MVVPKGKYNTLEVVMLDYKSIVRLKRLGLNNSAIASNVVKTTGIAGGSLYTNECGSLDH